MRIFRLFLGQLNIFVLTLFHIFVYGSSCDFSSPLVHPGLGGVGYGSSVVGWLLLYNVII